MTTPTQTATAGLSVGAYLNAQARISRSMVDLSRSLISRFGFPAAEDIERMAQVAYPRIERARRQSYVVSHRWMQRTQPQVRPAPITPYPRDAATTLITDVVEERTKVRVTVDPALDQVSRKPRVTITEALGGRMARHAIQAGRDAIVDTANRSEHLGWARVLSGAENCAWCVMLASRGPVYKTEATARAATHSHDFCDCVFVLAPRRGDWPGRDRYELAEDLWSEATRGFYGNDALNALRRQLARAEREHWSHQELLDVLRDEND